MSVENHSKKPDSFQSALNWKELQRNNVNQKLEKMEEFKRAIVIDNKVHVLSDNDNKFLENICLKCSLMKRCVEQMTNEQPDDGEELKELCSINKLDYSSYQKKGFVNTFSEDEIRKNERMEILNEVMEASKAINDCYIQYYIYTIINNVINNRNNGKQ